MAKSRNKRAQKSCLSLRGKPVFYTSTLTKDSRNLLTIALPELTPINYALSGWLEVVLEPPRKSDPTSKVGARIQVINIRAKLAGNADERVPRQLHITCTIPSEAHGTIDSKTGLGSIQIPIELSYPELTTDPKQLRPRKGHMLPRPIPLLAVLHLFVEFNLEKGGFIATGTLDLPKFPPLSTKVTPCVINFPCICDSKPHCLEMCLSIKVATIPATATTVSEMILTEAQVRDIIDRVNRIWGCGATGQCCIQFSITNIVALVSPPFTTIDDIPGSGYSEDFKKIISESRHPTCYDLYFVKFIRGAPVHGITGYKQGLFGSDYSGSVVESQRPPDTVALITAHELGHALGLNDVSTLQLI